MTILQEIIEYLHPDVVLQICDIPNDNARASFSIPNVTVRNYAEFQALILNYIKHHHKGIFGQPCNDLVALTWAQDSLGDLERIAYLGLSGAEGGVATLLSKISDYFKQTIRKNFFDMIINDLIDPLDPEAKIRLMAEFKEHLSNFAPAYFNYVSPEAMAADYRSIIYRYMEGIGRFRNLYRYY